ncbi:MAG: glyoxalase/bleomycin resistance/dioxygenase family protein [Bdellovibrio sp.]|nr:MAG: glyoxalase/bleomycin resistance/dioxygenase family protein [Bdellovibrio sp.]
MKRFHMHVGVKNLNEAVQFYSTLFGQKPTKLKDDYAKWMLEDPRVNFAISTRATTTGVDHIGIQVENPEELSEITERLKKADLRVFDEGETTCCYAQSNKAWVEDPAGIAWEAYQNMGEAEMFAKKQKEQTSTSACCAPKEASKI